MTDSLDDVTLILLSDWLLCDDVTEDTMEAVSALKFGLSMEGLGRINSSSASAENIDVVINTRQRYTMVSSSSSSSSSS